MTQGDHNPKRSDECLADVLCGNCCEPLRGRWCAFCGQKHLLGPPTIGMFLQELFVDLTHADSRFWRTLWALVAKPGFLAREFFDGRRVRYLPPLRLYLGISLVFFLYLSAETEVTSAVGQRDIGSPSGDPFIVMEDGTKRPLSTLLEGEAIEDPEIARKVAQLKQKIQAGQPPDANEDPCRSVYSGDYEEWLAPKLEDACREIQRDGGYALAQAFTAKLPTAMFLLMPLFALVMKLWYWRPSRYFTEHLVLQINNHSAIFIFVMVAKVVGALLGSVVGAAMSVATGIYAVVYTYRSLAVYYQQSKVLTRSKYLGLMLVYGLLLGVVLAFTGVVSIVSVLSSA